MPCRRTAYHKLRRAVLGILRRLFLPNPRQVPYMNTAVRRATRQKCLGVRAPGELKDLVRVGLEAVQALAHFTEVPEGDRLT